MSIRLNGATSGSIEINVPAVAGTDTAITIPATSGGEFIVSDSTGNIDLGPLDINGGAADDSVNIDGSARLLVGTSTFVGTGNGTKLQVISSDGGDTRTVSIGQTGVDQQLHLGALNSGTNYLTWGGYFDGGWNSDDSGNTLCIGGINFESTTSGSQIAFRTNDAADTAPLERVRLSEDGSLTAGRDNRNATFGTNDQFIINGAGYAASHGLNASAYQIGQNSNSRSLRIGSGSGFASTGVQLAAGATSWGTYSDERLKTDIVELADCLESIKDIRCVSYRLTGIDEADSKKRLGVIAQDLVGKYDEAINSSKRQEEDDTEYLSVQYTDLIPVLVKALQEATTKIETLEANNVSLEARLAALEGGTTP